MLTPGPEAQFLRVRGVGPGEGTCPPSRVRFLRVREDRPSLYESGFDYKGSSAYAEIGPTGWTAYAPTSWFLRVCGDSPYIGITIYAVPLVPPHKRRSTAHALALALALPPPTRRQHEPLTPPTSPAPPSPPPPTPPHSTSKQSPQHTHDAAPPAPHRDTARANTESAQSADAPTRYSDQATPAPPAHHALCKRVQKAAPPHRAMRSCARYSQRLLRTPRIVIRAPPVEFQREPSSALANLRLGERERQRIERRPCIER